MQFDLASLESRFRSIESTVEGDLHSKIGEAVVAVAKDLIGLLPDGAEVESVLGKLDELASVAHAAADVVAAPAAPETPPEAPQTPAEPPAAEPAPDAAQTGTGAAEVATEPDPPTAGQARPQ